MNKYVLIVVYVIILSIQLYKIIPVKIEPGTCWYYDKFSSLGHLQGDGWYLLYSDDLNPVLLSSINESSNKIYRDDVVKDCPKFGGFLLESEIKKIEELGLLDEVHSVIKKANGIK